MSETIRPFPYKACIVCYTTQKQSVSKIDKVTSLPELENVL